MAHYGSLGRVTDNPSTPTALKTLETAPSIGSTRNIFGSAHNSRRNLGVLIAVTSAFAAVWAVGSLFNVNETTKREYSTALDVGVTSIADDDEVSLKVVNEYSFYKITFPVANGTGLQAYEKLTSLMCPPMSDSPAALGCDGIKVGCDVMLKTKTSRSDKTLQLHFVDAPRLPSGIISIEEWQEYFSELNQKMTRFNQFSHNKVQLFTPDLTNVFKLFEEDRIPYMKRVSLGDDGVTEEFAHMAFEIAGRIFEIIGDPSSLPNKTGFIPWQDDECSAAHHPSGTYDEISTQWMDLYETDDDGEADDWFETTHVPEMMFVGLQIATSDTSHIGFSALESDMAYFTGANILRSTGTCNVMELSWSQMPLTSVKYIDNPDAYTGKYSVEDYENNIHNAHVKYTSIDKEWFSWDHWLDQHVGIMNSLNSRNDDDIGIRENDICLGQSREIAKHLEASDIPVGLRKEDDGSWNESHYYSGYHGSMSWEYLLYCQEYHANAIPNVCTCIGKNNNIKYEEKTGKVCW